MCVRTVLITLAKRRQSVNSAKVMRILRGKTKRLSELHFEPMRGLVRLNNSFRDVEDHPVRGFVTFATADFQGILWPDP